MKVIADAIKALCMVAVLVVMVTLGSAWLAAKIVMPVAVVVACVVVILKLVGAI